MAICYMCYMVQGHSWIDELICECTGEVGYPRNFVSRVGRTDFDTIMTYRILGRNPDAPVCSAREQSSTEYTATFPKLKCPAGSIVRFKYNPNGHVMKDACLNGDPRGCGATVGDKVLTKTTSWSIHWDGKQRLNTRKDINSIQKFNDDSGLINFISKGNSFDDGQCGEGRGNKPCEGTFRIPLDAPVGASKQFLWYWIFDRDFNGSGEEYTKCFDIDILPSESTCSGGLEAAKSPVQRTSAPKTKTPKVYTPTPVVIPSVYPTLPNASVVQENCVALVSKGDKLVGVSAFLDASNCPGIGCFTNDSSCRYCKEQDTPQSKHFVPCP